MENSRERFFARARERRFEKNTREEKALPQSPNMEREIYFKIFMKSSGKISFGRFLRLISI